VLVEASRQHGSDSYNQELSDQRQCRADGFDRYGISSERVTTRGYGERFRLAATTPPRPSIESRVEIILSDNKGNIAPR